MQIPNYILDVQQPFQSALSGMQAGFSLGAAMDQNAARQQEIQQKQIAMQQQQQAMQQQMQMQSDLGDLAQKANPTAQDFASITTKYPALAEHFKNTWGMLNQDQQQARLSQATQVYAALNSGNADIAKNLLTKQRDAAINSGKADDAQASDTMIKMIDTNPQTATTSAGLMLSSILGPEKFSSTFSTLEKLPGEVKLGEAAAAQKAAEAKQKSIEAANTPQRLFLENAQNKAQIRNIDSQISERSNRLGLDRDKLQSEAELKLYELGQKVNPALVTLDDGAKKIINDSTVASVAAGQSANQMTNLAGQLEKTGGGYGAAGSAAEWLKKATGNQDALTQMRQEYVRIRSSQVSKMLPPGAASDKDVALAMAGFPPETADANTLASFLRGMSKLSNYTSATENAKAEWVNAVGHLGKPKTDINVAGVNVPAGATFTDFASKYIDSKASQQQAQQGQAQTSARSYMRYAQGQK